MKVFYKNSTGVRQEFEWNNEKIKDLLIRNNVLIEQVKLFPKIYRNSLNTISFAELSNNRSTETTSINATAGSVGVAYYGQNENEVYSTNFQVRTDHKPNCIDIDLFLRIYPKGIYEACMDKEFLVGFHNISIDDAKKGFIIGFNYNGKDYPTYFSQEEVERLWISYNG